jgi:hypothetical protein
MRQAWENRLVYVIFAEDGLVLLETQAPQPNHNVHHGALKRLPLVIAPRGQSVQRSRRMPESNLGQTQTSRFASKMSLSHLIADIAAGFAKPIETPGRDRQSSGTTQVRPRYNSPFVKPVAVPPVAAA